MVHWKVKSESTVERVWVEIDNRGMETGRYSVEDLLSGVRSLPYEPVKIPFGVRHGPSIANRKALIKVAATTLFISVAVNVGFLLVVH